VQVRPHDRWHGITFVTRFLPHGRWRWITFVGGFLAGFVVLVLANSVLGIVHGGSQLEPGDLVILSGTDESGGQRQHLLEQWNAGHPRNHARIESLSKVAELQHSGMVGQAQQRDGRIDIYNLDVTWTAEFAAAGYIRPFGPADTDGFLPRVLQTCRFDNQLWALPFNTDAGLLYYRTDIFGPNGDRIPTDQPPSPQDMRQIVAQPRTSGAPTLKAGYVTQLSPYEGLTVNALETIGANGGGDIVSDDGRVVMDPAKVSHALQPLAQATATAPGEIPGLLADSSRYDETQSATEFASGEVAMMRNWPVWFGRLPDLSRGGGFTIAGHFNVKAPMSSVLGGQNLAVATDTTRPRAAKALIEFLTSPSSERTLFGDGSLPATRTDVYRDPAVQKKQPYAPVLLAALNEARPRPVTTHYPLFSKTFQDLVTSALGNDGRLPADAGRRLTNALAGRIQ
jgi:multiple sugar transport system substrate-binding protein